MRGRGSQRSDWRILAGMAALESLLGCALVFVSREKAGLGIVVDAIGSFEDLAILCVHGSLFCRFWVV